MKHRASESAHTCWRHQLQMLGILISGQLHTPRHGEVLEAIRRCPRCS